MSHEKKKSSPSKCAYAIVVAGSLAVIGLAVASSAVMASARQCTIYAEYSPRPYIVAYTDFSPFVYLVVANAIAAFLEAIAVFLNVCKKGEEKAARKAMPLIGAVVPALLYSSTGAAFAAGADMTYCSYGGKRLSICASSAGSTFCGQVHLAVDLSLGAAAAVSFVEVVRSLAMSKASSGDDSDSDSESEVSGHGCHSKH